MAIVDKLLDQVERTKQRSAESLPSLIERAIIPGARPAAETAESPGSTAPTDVVPRQMRNYVNGNNVDISRLINDPLFRERIINGDDILDTNYLARGLQAAKSICRVCILDDNQEEQGYGTGFMIGPGILITNNHVLPQESFATFSYIEFNFEQGINDLPITPVVFRLNPATLFYTNVELDYTVVSIRDTAEDGVTLINSFGSLRMNPQLGKTKKGNYVSIIQHPGGKRKKVALRENQVTNLEMPKVIRYVTDTMQGSSGAAVFNDRWEVVALHHSGIPRYDEAGNILNLNGTPWDKSQGDDQIYWEENEGIRVSSIVYDLTNNAAIQFPFLLNHFEKLTDPQSIQTSMGIPAGQTDAYYSEAKDKIDRDKYYQSIDITSVDFNSLHSLVTDTHTKHQNYSPSRWLYPVVDMHPDGLLRSIYSGKTFTLQEIILADKKVDIEREMAFIELSKSKEAIDKESYNAELDGIEERLPYNCEHVVCQSWFRKQEPMRGDLHHLFACESGCNSFRNNHPYEDFPGYEPEPADELVEKLRKLCGNMEQGRFEPENNKGVVARAVLYFFVRYPKAIDEYDQGKLDMLIAWSKSQPVSKYELHRNGEIFLQQGNRNPFIDFPDLVDTFDFTPALP